jgi:hypothetical protein
VEARNTLGQPRNAIRRGAANGSYDEAWLQRQLHQNPEVPPVEQIEPGFGHPIPLCRELPLTFGAGRSGALDNLFVTKEGRLLLVETKLWRNPEARRSVVAQAMEYAAAVFRLDYEELQSAVLRARASEAEQCGSIYDIVAKHVDDLDEPEFVDAVSRNLARGRAIIAVVGDGIREDLVPLAELLQTHAGHRFTFALIELAVYEAPQAGVRIVTPSVLAQTALIERGVVQIEDRADGGRRIVIREPVTTVASTSRERSFGIGEDEFFEILEQRAPGAPALIKSLLAKAEKLGIYADLQGGLNLKHAPPNGSSHPLNVGTIEKGGLLDTGPASWWGRNRTAQRYNDHLASLTGGRVREFNNGKENGLRTATGRMPRVFDLLPVHEEAWLAAIDQYVRDSDRPAEEDVPDFSDSQAGGVDKTAADGIQPG